jgi:hypothetical protein
MHATAVDEWLAAPHARFWRASDPAPACCHWRAAIPALRLETGEGLKSCKTRLAARHGIEGLAVECQWPSIRPLELCSFLTHLALQFRSSADISAAHQHASQPIVGTTARRHLRK